MSVPLGYQNFRIFSLPSSIIFSQNASSWTFAGLEGVV
jgi:hypothetical protein